MSSLCKYFELQSNILILHRMMSEPIYSLTEKKDSLDLMFEMQMTKLLQHPVIIEMLDMVKEGKYSTSLNPLDVSYTFQCTLEMPTVSIHSITDKLIQNCLTFGALVGKQRQVSLQFHIWKQSIDQRQFDEMVLTIFLTGLMILAFIVQLIQMDIIHDNEVYHLKGSLSLDRTLAKSLTLDELHEFCKETIDNAYHWEEALKFFESLSIIYTIGMTANLVQEVVRLRLLSNVSLNPLAILN